ncbi:MAG: polysaccharide biosynthesis tyrosine autokinase [Deltaproteobacteria bacterium]|nr:polysaccharide biosynthesis tyrosine autokinase [Deltaproteobacteria bacterium]
MEKKGYDLSIRDYLFILKKRKRIIVLVVLLTLTAVIFGTYVNTPSPEYKATSSVRVERITDVTGFLMEVISYPLGDVLAGQMEMIRSFDVMEKVAKALGLIPRDATVEEVSTNEQYRNAISSIRDAVTVERQGNSNIISISATSNSAEKAQRLANLVAEQYREVNIVSRNKRVFEAKDFVEKRLGQVEEKLKSAEEELRSFREGATLAHLTEKEMETAKKLVDIEGKIEDLRAEKAEVDYAVQLVKQGRMISPRSQLTVERDQGTIVAALKIYSDLLLKKENLLLTYFPAHPAVKAVDGELENTKVELLKHLIAQSTGYQKRVDLLEGELKILQAKARQLPAEALSFERLKREVDINGTLYTQLKTKYQELLIKEAERIEEVSIVNPAVKPSSPVNRPSYLRNGFLGILIGLLLGLVFSVFYESYDTSITTVEEIEAILEVPVLGVIPYLGDKEMKEEMVKAGDKIPQDPELFKALFTYFTPDHFLTEAFRILRTALSKVESARVIAVSSPASREGKTFVMMNLAVSIAQTGKKVLVIDADFQMSMVNRLFGIPREPGLSDVILRNVPFSEAARSIVDLILGERGFDFALSGSGLENVHILPTGGKTPKAREMLSVYIKDIFEEVKKSKEFDYIIIDTPPILPVMDAVELSTHVDGVLLVYEAGKVPKMALRRARTHILNAGGRILGAVLNKMKAEVSPDYYKYTYTHYYGGKEKEA